ncbi:MAG: hypothetical protein QXP36_02100 [Conexivisphaerales archaeon]
MPLNTNPLDPIIISLIRKGGTSLKPITPLSLTPFMQEGKICVKFDKLKINVCANSRGDLITEFANQIINMWRSGSNKKVLSTIFQEED